MIFAATATPCPTRSSARGPDLLVHSLTDAPKKIAEFILVVGEGFEERRGER
jgi:hypothetical protein